MYSIYFEGIAQKKIVPGAKNAKADQALLGLDW
jgi:hypothetical protein